MPESAIYQSDFTAGEFSPRLFARSDLRKYGKALAVCENMIVQKHGGATRRPGTQFIADTKDSAAGTDRVARLVEFEFSVTQTYILEFGHLYIRFYRDKEQMSNGGTPTEIVSPYSSTDLVNLKFTQSADVLYIMSPTFETRTLSRGPGDDTLPATWTLALVGIDDGPFLDINTTATTLNPDGSTGTPTIVASAVTGINDGDGFLSTDVRRLIRYSNDGTSWGWCRIDTVNSTTSVTVTVIQTLPGGPDPPASSDWSLGAWSDTTGWPQTGTIHQSRLIFGGNTDLPQTIWGSLTGRFTEFRPSDASSGVNPVHGIVLTIDDDRVNAIRWLVSDDRGLLALTNGAVFVVGGPDEVLSATEAPRVARQTTEGAAATVRPHLTGGAVMMPTSSTRRVVEILFRFETERFTPVELTLLSEHITSAAGLVDSAYQEEPNSVLWGARSDGQLAAMTYERLEEVVGWHRHILGGTLAGAAQPDVESVASIRDGNDDLLWMIVRRTIGGTTRRFVEFMQVYDPEAPLEDAWFVDAGLALDTPVTITGATNAEPVVVTAAAHGFSNGDRVRIRDVKGMTDLNDLSYTIFSVTVNTFALRNAEGADINGTAFGTYVSGGEAHLETVNITGLSHLAGEQVAILANGGVHATKTVSATGTVTLDNAASRVLVGLPYTSTLTTLPIVVTERGETRGEFHRLNKAVAIFDRSLGGEYGLGGTFHAINYRDFGDDMDTPPTPFTGRREFSLPGRMEMDVQLTIRSSDPVPMTVLGLAGKVESGNI